MPGKYAALTMSRGEQFQPPPLTPRSHGVGEWPTNATVHTIFYDTAGGTIADIAGTVTPTAITFDVDPSEVDIVPAGAHFETFVVTEDGKNHQIRYGQVIRKEAYFANRPATDTSAVALQFRDNFYARTGLVGSKWVPVLGKPTIFDNSGAGKPNGVGPHMTLFVDAAMRYYAPLNSDTATLSFNVLNPGAGKTGIVLCSNADMSSYLFAMFETGIANNYLHMGVGQGPIALIDEVTKVPHITADNANYKLRYDDQTKKLVLLNSDMTSELITWTDSDEIVPHGPGYRYFGANWQASLASSGVQLTSISAQDGV
ncbi:LtfC-like domain-containing protein [Mycolicibacterium fortuitum]|uniref:LtfC-like domain-containing protein n=1 Tax=Mycolicibacterium fortuitum TaxID=1766 RepID=UPI00263974A8|nr:hypothetical protein [Mycolicibacterium fortuitum]